MNEARRDAHPHRDATGAGSMMRHFSSNVGVQQLGPNQLWDWTGVCRMFMQPSMCVPFGIRHIVGGQVGGLYRQKQPWDKAAAVC